MVVVGGVGRVSVGRFGWVGNGGGKVYSRLLESLAVAMQKERNGWKDKLTLLCKWVGLGGYVWVGVDVGRWVVVWVGESGGWMRGGVW